MVHMTLRILITVPLAPVVALCMVSIIGIPLGLAIGMAAGAWATSPLRKHPLFNTKDQTGDADWDEIMIEDLT
jgi:hypothetical protein